MFYGKQTTAARVDSVQAGSAAAAAGFQPGDVIVAIDGRQIESFAEMQRDRQRQRRAAARDRGRSRRRRAVTLKATPELREMKDNFGNVHRIGVLGISRVDGRRRRCRSTASAARRGLGVERPGS